MTNMLVDYISVGVALLMSITLLCLITSKTIIHNQLLISRSTEVP